MAERVQKTKTATKKQAEAVEELPEAKDADLLDSLDALLDEIDEVLEENAERFVKDYVQKGGE